MRARTLLVVFLVLAAVGIAWLARGSRPSGEAAVPEARAQSAALESAPVDPLETVELPAVDPSTEREVATPASPKAPTGRAFPKNTVLVQVVDARTEQPLAGATVTVFASEDDVTGIEHATDERGECRAEAPERDQRLWLAVIHTGYAHHRGRYDDSSKVRISLSPAVAIEGRVVDAEGGRPVSGAQVQQYHPSCKGCRPYESVTDSEGRYEMSAVPLHAWIVFQVRAEGFPRHSRSVELRSEESLARVDFRLASGTEISGVVSDLMTGLGIHRATLDEMGTDGRGRFRGRVLPQDELSEVVRFVARASGYCERSLSFRLDELRTGEPIEILLPRSATVEGFVRDAEGRPVSDAFVRLDEDDARNVVQGDHVPQAFHEMRSTLRETHHSVRTDESGFYEVPDALPWITGWRLLVLADGFGSHYEKLDATPGPGERARLDVALGTPMRGATVELVGRVRLNGSPVSGTLRWKGSGSLSGESHFFAGQYWVEVEPGRVELTFDVPGLPDSVEGRFVVLDVPDVEELRRDFGLTLPEKSITGRVRSLLGEPIEGARLTTICALDTSSGPNHLFFRAETDAEGRYSLDVPDLDGLYRVELNLSNETHAVEDVRAGSERIDFTVSWPGLVLLRARAQGSPTPLDLGELEVWWSKTTEERLWSLSFSSHVADPEGWYEVHLPSGEVDLGLHPTRGRYAEASARSVRVPRIGDAPTRVDLELPLGLELTLQLAQGLEPPSTDYRVYLIQAGWWEAFDPKQAAIAAFRKEPMCRAVRWSESGAWTSEGLSIGGYRFKVFPPDLAIDPETIDLSDGQSRTVEIRWKKLP